MTPELWKKVVEFAKLIEKTGKRKNVVVEYHLPKRRGEQWTEFKQIFYVDITEDMVRLQDYDDYYAHGGRDSFMIFTDNTKLTEKQFEAEKKRFKAFERVPVKIGD